MKTAAHLVTLAPPYAPWSCVRILGGAIFLFLQLTSFPSFFFPLSIRLPNFPKPSSFTAPAPRPRLQPPSLHLAPFSPLFAAPAADPHRRRPPLPPARRPPSADDRPLLPFNYFDFSNSPISTFEVIFQIFVYNFIIL